jgi:hypothetical protein
VKSFIPISGIKYAAVGRKLNGVDGSEKVWREYMNKYYSYCMLISSQKNPKPKEK